MARSERKLPFHRRLGVQMGFTIAIVTIANFVVASLFVVTRERDTLTRELTRRLLAEAQSLSAALSGHLLRHDPELELHPLVLRALQQTPDWIDLVVLNSEDDIVGHRDLLRVGSRFEPPALQPIALPEADTHAARVGLDGNDIVILQPVRHLDRAVGKLVVRASRAGIEATLAASQRRLVAVGIVGAIVGTLAGVVFVGWHLRPLGDLHRGVVRLGSGDLAARVRVRSRTELGGFGDVINSMAAGLESAQKRLIHKERLDRELEIAADLQTILLPRRVEFGAGYAIRTHYESALEVSGDYYDVIPVGPEHLAVVAADVSGKGVPGLVVMSMLRTVLHALTQPGRDLADVLAHAETVLRTSMRPGMFVTCVYGVLDARRHVFRYVSAGHCPPARFGPGGAEWLPAGGKPLGLFPSALFRASLVQREVALGPGDGLVLYTDGLVEALDSAGRTVGFAPILSTLEQAATCDADAVLSRLLARLAAHRGGQAQSDDTTLLVLRREPAAVRQEAPA
jgi:serine phosphatase RsbU (regulator of sigma subunit)